ncbi:DoxX family protein [Chitinophaga sp. 212800010-3]|uniref:DoxX family protein n=1 Tax=unclassified Chitinophaga TaxID=2619133 RepID=UPI002DEA6A63|nr:DoxX family protein [Chitinophaga sp. 212800010-3]
MKTQQPSKSWHISLWVAQILLALFFLTGAILKFMPAATAAGFAPWIGQVPLWQVRLLAVIDLAGSLGLILPTLLRIKPILTTWTAGCAIVLMLCAIIFHISRNEANVIGANIVAIFMAAFIAWGRSNKH